MKDIRRALVLAGAAGALVLGSAGVASASAIATATATGTATDTATNRPSVLSGNLIQIPIHLPAHVCGNSIGLFSFLNPASGSDCSNVG